MSDINSILADYRKYTNGKAATELALEAWFDDLPIDSKWALFYVARKWVAAHEAQKASA